MPSLVSGHWRQLTDAGLPPQVRCYVAQQVPLVVFSGGGECCQPADPVPHPQAR
jgi:hypothetical protein